MVFDNILLQNQLTENPIILKKCIDYNGHLSDMIKHLETQHNYIFIT